MITRNVIRRLVALWVPLCALLATTSAEAAPVKGCGVAAVQGLGSGIPNFLKEASEPLYFRIPFPMQASDPTCKADLSLLGGSHSAELPCRFEGGWIEITPLKTSHYERICGASFGHLGPAALQVSGPAQLAIEIVDGRNIEHVTVEMYVFCYDPQRLARPDLDSIHNELCEEGPEEPESICDLLLSLLTLLFDSWLRPFLEWLQRLGS